MSVHDTLAARGIVLPAPPPPGGAYDPVRVIGGMAFVAVQFPVRDGARVYLGRLGRDLTTDDGYEAARLCALNVLAQLDRHPGLDQIAGLARLDACMQTVDGWNDFPRVLDGASHLFLEALGEKGRHARTLCGVERLPGNACLTLTVTAVLHGQ